MHLSWCYVSGLFELSFWIFSVDLVFDLGQVKKKGIGVCKSVRMKTVNRLANFFLRLAIGSLGLADCAPSLYKSIRMDYVAHFVNQVLLQTTGVMIGQMA